GLAAWHPRHVHCPRCGAPTVSVLGGWVRRCTVDGSDHYPRTDPAVIMAVTDDQDRLLLGHAPHWPERRFSTLAGYVEPGESLEAAVRREVGEEVGVVVGEVAYQGSQPWPFPASLMLAFTARATSTEIDVDGDELTEARWFTRDELVGAVGRGEVLLPTRASVARALIEDWLGAPIESD
ncbi:NAD(+) diphosphatase, partial [Actinotalea sp. C106]|uniref:NAD(+) diphosphatase n=1 Tax=Actinotalea sp. C106 TaxID=2908644 RepID=UPI0020279DB8